MSDNSFLIRERILQDISGGILFIKGGKIGYVNPAAAQILNKPAREMIEKPFAQVFMDYEENDDFNQTILDVILDPENTREGIVQYFNGETFKHFHIKTSFLHEGNKKIGILMLLDDITELMKLRGVELDFQKIKELNQELKKESETDKLTGLLNKKALEYLCREFLLLDGEESAALYVIDLDHFKEANDTYGHQCGDMILQRFANFLLEIFGKTAFVGRFGGDEFVVLLKRGVGGGGWRKKINDAFLERRLPRVV